MKPTPFPNSAKRIAGFLAAAVFACCSLPASGQSLDRMEEREDTGIYRRAVQKRLDNAAIATMLTLALVEGSDSRLGRASWQAIDASVTAALTTETMKRVFTRPRPAENPNAGVWFAGGRHRSFPSGEVALMASFVTPYIYAYKDDYPVAYGLLVLPLYMGNARMKSQAHWTTDVLAGAAVGWGMGYLAVKRETPLVLALTGRGAWVGWRHQF